MTSLPSSSLYADSFEATRTGEQQITMSGRKALMRETETLRQQIASLGAQHSFMGMNSAATASSAPGSSVLASTSSHSAELDPDAELRRELGSLRIEFARLEAETGSNVKPMEPPPAYA